MSQENEKNEIGKLAQEIAEYLRAHQDAADTLEGIVNWWLQRQRLKRCAEKIQKVLQSQVGRGMIQKALDMLEEGGVVRKHADRNVRAQKPIYSYAKGNAEKRSQNAED